MDYKKDMGFLNILMRIYNIKETERRKQNMEKECSIGEMEVFIRESL